VRRRIGPWIAAGLWAAWIFFASTERFGSNHTSKHIVPFLRWLLPHASLSTLLFLHLAIRKTAHVFEYFVFSVLLWRAIRAEGRAEDRVDGRVEDRGDGCGESRGDGRRWQFRWALLAILIAAVYAASDEFHQIFVPGRGASVHDVMIDVCGATLAQLVIWLWLRPRRDEATE
jgi:VanZ family protein